MSTFSFKKFYRNKLSKKQGFTLLEILLVVAILGVLSGLAIPVYQSFKIKNDLDVAANTIAQTLRRAQILSQAIAGDSSWGVYVQSGYITLYKGNDFNDVGRDNGFDEVFDMLTTITPSGIGEIYFNKTLGQPQVIGDIILTSINQDVRTININSKGTIAY